MALHGLLVLVVVLSGLFRLYLVRLRLVRLRLIVLRLVNLVRHDILSRIRREGRGEPQPSRSYLIPIRQPFSLREYYAERLIYPSVRSYLSMGGVDFLLR